MMNCHSTPGRHGRVLGRKGHVSHLGLGLAPNSLLPPVTSEYSHTEARSPIARSGDVSWRRTQLNKTNNNRNKKDKKDKNKKKKNNKKGNKKRKEQEQQEQQQEGQDKQDGQEGQDK